MSDLGPTHVAKLNYGTAQAQLKAPTKRSCKSQTPESLPKLVRLDQILECASVLARENYMRVADCELSLITGQIRLVITKDRKGVVLHYDDVLRAKSFDECLGPMLEADIRQAGDALNEILVTAPRSE